MIIREDIGGREISDFSGQEIERMEPRIIIEGLTKRDSMIRDKKVVFKFSEIDEIKSSIHKDKIESEEYLINDYSRSCGHESEKYNYLYTKNYNSGKTEVRRKNIKFCEKCLNKFINKLEKKKNIIKESFEYWSDKGICLKKISTSKRTLFSNEKFRGYTLILNHEGEIYVRVSNVDKLRKILSSPCPEEEHYSIEHNSYYKDNSCCLVCGIEVEKNYYSIMYSSYIHSMCLSKLKNEIDDLIEKKSNIIVSSII